MCSIFVCWCFEDIMKSLGWYRFYRLMSTVTVWVSRAFVDFSNFSFCGREVMCMYKPHEELFVMCILHYQTNIQHCGISHRPNPRTRSSNATWNERLFGPVLGRIWLISNWVFHLTLQLISVRYGHHNAYSPGQEQCIVGAAANRSGLRLAWVWPKSRQVPDPPSPWL